MPVIGIKRLLWLPWVGEAAVSLLALIAREAASMALFDEGPVLLMELLELPEVV
jgi:hypothetical protein